MDDETTPRSPGKDEAPETRAFSRRGMIAGAVAAGAGIVATGMLIGAEPASATQGSAVLLGADNTGATSRTGLFSTDNTWVAQLADPTEGYGVGGQDNSGTTSGIAVSGISESGTGVYGSSAGTGVYGTSSGNGKHGVSGYNTNAEGGVGVYGSTISGAGVFGETTGDGSPGVSGSDNSTGGGFGVQGSSNTGIGVQGLTTADGQAAVSAIDESDFGGFGLSASSTAGTAVLGTTTGDGKDAIAGENTSAGGGVGVHGSSTNGTGVHGTTTGNGQSGVAGMDTSTHGGHGLYGTSTKGIGVYAESAKGTALHVNGPVHFSTSGTTKVPAGHSKVTVSLSGVTTASLILATPQADVDGVYVRSAVPASGGFTINLSKKVTSALAVAWFVIG